MKNAYVMVMACIMAWTEDAIDNHPILSALVTALVIDRFLW